MPNIPDIENLKIFLEEKYLQFNNPDFVLNDPIAVPHLFSEPEDIEIAGFLTAVISWGRREMIAKAGYELMRRMDFKPAEFVMHGSDEEIASLAGFVYRTFNAVDAMVFVYSLRDVCTNYKTLENAFFEPFPMQENAMAIAINRFKQRFFGMFDPGRSGKHLSDPLRNAAAKRINMFLRWMIRSDGRGVDFGIWNSIPPSRLICPLDLHSASVARKLGLLSRKQNDWKAAMELTENLRNFDPADPVKYDFALFGLGWYERF